MFIVCPLIQSMRKIPPFSHYFLQVSQALLTCHIHPYFNITSDMIRDIQFIKVGFNNCDTWIRFVGLNFIWYSFLFFVVFLCIPILCFLYCYFFLVNCILCCCVCISCMSKLENILCCLIVDIYHCCTVKCWFSFVVYVFVEVVLRAIFWDPSSCCLWFFFICIFNTFSFCWTGNFFLLTSVLFYCWCYLTYFSSPCMFSYSF